MQCLLTASASASPLYPHFLHTIEHHPPLCTEFTSLQNAMMHNGHGHNGHGHSHGHAHGSLPPSHPHHHGHDASAAAADMSAGLESNERLATLQPERVVRDVIAPLVRAISPSTGGPAGTSGLVVVADIGAGTGAFALPLARLLRDGCSIIATDTEESMRSVVAARAVAEGLAHLSVATGSGDRMGLPAGVKAGVALLVEVYHHLSAAHGECASEHHGDSALVGGNNCGTGGSLGGSGGTNRRVEYLRQSALLDVLPGGFIVSEWAHQSVDVLTCSSPIHLLAV